MARTFEELGIDLSRASQHAGGNYRTLCPWCSEDRKREHRTEKCLSVNPSKGAYNCFNCGERGRLDGVDWRDTIRHYEPPIIITSNDIEPDAISYFQHRGISIDTLRFMRVTAESGVIKFPYYLNGEHVNTKHRAIRNRKDGRKRLKMDPGARLTWWNIDRVRDAKTVLIVEGEPDLLTMVELGMTWVISLPNGAQTGTMDFFDDLDWDSVDKALLGGDMDEPGEKCMNECAARIGKEKCYRVRWVGANDANETLVNFGPEAVLDAISMAQPFPVEGINQPGDDHIWESLLTLYREGLPPGLATGWPMLNKGYSVSPGILDIWSGFPGSGKSELLDQLLVDLGVKHDYRTCMYSPENYPIQLHLEKLCRKFVGKPFKEGVTERMSEEELWDANQWLNRHIHMLNPDNPTIDEILRLAKIEKRRFGINGLTIDPWNTILHEMDKGESGTDYVGRQLTKIRKFLRDHDLHVWVLAHPRKPESTNKGIVPSPYEIAGSHNFFSMADSLLAVGRNKKDISQPVEVHIQKVRHRHLGRNGVCQFQWFPATGKYLDLTWGEGGVIV